MAPLLTLQSEITPILAVSGSGPARLPGWASLFAEVVESLVEEAEGREVSPEPDTSTPVAFEEIFKPFVKVGRRKISGPVPAIWSRLSMESRATLERQLLKDLSGLAGRALWFEFSLFQQEGRFFFQAASSEGRAGYDRFVAKMAVRSNFVAFFQQYPVLARLLATRLNQWLAATTVFLERLAADWASLERLFAGPFERVTEIRPGLSDPHAGGRQVLALTFDEKTTLVYKPRNLTTETGFQNLLAWCSARLSLDLANVKVLGRDEYGWVEFVRPAPCQDRAGLKNFYHRAGVLLGLLYALRGNDYHYQNVIARGEYPLLLDLEGLFYPPPPANNREQTDEFTVLHTGFLPNWQVLSGGEKYDQSGLAGLPQPDREKADWLFVNSDRMRPGEKKGSIARSEKGSDWPHRPALAGNPLPVEPYLYQAELLEGFRQIGALLLRERAVLQSPAGPLAFFQKAPVRFVFRPTQVYHDLLKLALEPKYLRSEAARQQVLGRIGRSLEGSDRLRPLVQAELTSLDQLDVPQFMVEAASLDLQLPDGKIYPRFFQESGYALALAQLAELDEAAIERQVRYIRAAFYSYEAGRAKLAKTGSSGIETGFEPTLALEAAARIARNLKEQAVAGPHGTGWDWLDNTRQPERFYQPAGFDFSLYSGQGGIALFLAAFARISGRAEYRQLALDAWQPFCHRLGRGELTGSEINGLGGGFGAGSLVYALVTVAELLAAPDLLTVAEGLAGWAFTDDRIAADSRFDVLGGTAGALLGLLALSRHRPTERISERLEACARHLLTNRVGSSGSRTWKTLEGHCWSGFSHGAAGIACALLELYRVQPEAAYLEAVREAFNFERSLFSREAGNWSDYAGASSENGWTSWCHGAPGAGLARLSAFEILEDPPIREELEVALKTTLAQPLTGLDHVCCGNFGRLDFLIEAAHRLGRTDLLEAARERAGTLLRRPGGFTLSGPRPLHLTGPGFFQGLSGIGYELLRLVEPGILKSVLVWA